VPVILVGKRHGIGLQGLEGEDRELKYQDGGNPGQGSEGGHPPIPKGSLRPAGKPSARRPRYAENGNKIQQDGGSVQRTLAAMTEGTHLQDTLGRMAKMAGGGPTSNWYQKKKETQTHTRYSPPSWKNVLDCMILRASPED